MIEGITIRIAGPADADTVANLHATSWRSAYRGAMSDEYLDGPVHEERKMFWRARFSTDARLVLFIAERGAAACGFIAWVPDGDPDWGGLIDNFHILPGEKGRGLGRRLLAEVLRLSAAERPGQGLYLWVLEANLAAQKAYQALGGRQASRVQRMSGDGIEHPVFRYVWPAPVADADSVR